MLLFTFFNSLGQTRQCDLSLKVVNTFENFVIPFADTFDVIVNIKNNGPDSILQNDTLLIGTVGFPAYSAMTDTIIAPGDSISFLIMRGWADENQTDDDTSDLCLFLVSADNYTDNNAANDSTCITVVFKGSNSVSINEKVNNLQVSIYPNPSNGLMQINTESIISSIEIIDLMGRNVYHSAPLKSNPSINVSQLASAMYWLKAKSVDGKMAAIKIVKE